MEPPVSSFEDPALKSALQRSLPKERAPEGLRQRIAAMATAPRAAGEAAPMRITPESAPVAQVPVRNLRFSLQRWGRLAAAAVFAIAAVVAAVVINKRQNAPTPGYEIANSVFKGMVKTHEERKSGAASPDTVTSLASASALSKSLGRPILAADLTKDGWSFQGGAVRTVASFQAAQLYFTKGKTSVSVLSLPASAATTAKEGSTYETSFQGTPIAGFVKQGGLFCILGQSDDNSLTIEEIKSLLQKHRDEIVKA
jgi:hypothetical protein